MRKRRRRQGFQGRGGGRKGEARSADDGADAGAQSASSTCPICQEEFCAAAFPVVHAPCGHVACAPCSVRWLKSKSSRTCALCRSPVLSIAHCPLLEQLLAQSGSSAVAPDCVDAPTEMGVQREDMKKTLRALSVGDLNELPGDHRGHVVRAVAVRAIRKGDLTLLQRCLEKYGARASTELLCTVAEKWQGEPRPAISLLLAHGCRVNGHGGDRPLLCAASGGNTQMMRALMDMRANPRLVASPSGETALHIAARRGRFEAARLLLDSGVPADLEDNAGQTPLSLAEQGKKMHMSYCSGYAQEGSSCQRCEARIQVHGEMRWRVNASASLPGHPGGALPARPDALQNDEDDALQDDGTRYMVPDALQDDEESNQSSSQWEASTSHAASDVEEWLEDGEEEDGDASEEGNDAEQDDDEEDS